MFAVEPVLAIELPDLRRDFARAPLSHRLLEQPLFVGEIEINHDSSLGFYSRVMRYTRSAEIEG